jgi:hypothetical protein
MGNFYYPTARGEDLDSSDSPQNSPNSRSLKKWSVFVYVDGDNNLEDFAVEDVNEMEKIGSNDDINIVVQVDRVSGYNTSNGDWTDTRRFYVTQDDDPIIINSRPEGTLGELNMADPKTLQDFLEWGLDNYPAEHYLIVMWDHGRGIFRSSNSNSGIFKGFNEDLTSNSQEMKLWELKEVMQELKAKNGGKSFDIIAFDQCWLGNVETAYELMDTVDYLIASSDEEPDKGYNYERPLSVLVDNPDMEPSEFAIQITNDYVEEYENKPSYDYMTQATIDLKELNRTFMPLMNDFSKILMDEFYEYQDVIFSVRQKSENYKHPHPDLFYFILQIQENESLPDNLRGAAANLMANYSGIILAEGHGSSHPNAYGLAIYFPDSLKYNKNSKWESLYDTNISFSNERWSEFLHMFYNPIRIDHEGLLDTEDTTNPYQIQAEVKGYMLNPNSIKVHYSTNKTDFEYINMASSLNNQFLSEIPAQDLNTSIFYYIEARDLSNNIIYLPDGAPDLSHDELFNFLVGPDLIPPEILHIALEDKIYSKEDFEISATVTDNILVNESKLMLYFKIGDDKNYVKSQMLPVPGLKDKYRAFIPSQLIGTNVFYHLEATDTARSPNTAQVPETGDYQFNILGIIINIARDRNHTRFDGEYEKFFDYLRSPGYNIIDVNEELTVEHLEDMDLLVIVEPEKPFSSSELDALKYYLTMGGRLLIIGASDPTIMNPLTQYIGITWQAGTEASSYTGTFGDNEFIFDDVNELYYSQIELTIKSEEPARILVENDLETSVLAAYSYYDQGKIIVLTSGFFSDVSFELSNNVKFLDNLAFWLVKCPIAVPLGPGTLINGKPSFEINNDTIEIYEDDYIGFDGNNSVYPEWQTTTLNFTWDFGDGNFAYEPLPAYKFISKGKYMVKLTVRTHDDYTDTAQIMFNVNNVIPQAYPGYKTIDGLNVYFDASATKDTPSDLTKLTYTWDFGDGQSADGIAPIHTYDARDVYYVTLTVTDDNGAKSITKMRLDLSEPETPSLLSYLPAILAVFLVIIIILIYMYMQKKKSNITNTTNTTKETQISKFKKTQGTKGEGRGATDYKRL